MKKEKNNKKLCKTSIGGQAVLEGVMMRGVSSMATAVRDEEGIIRIESARLKPADKKNCILRFPIIRGIVNFFASMIIGTKTLMRSADVYGESEPTKFESWLSKKLKVDLMSIMIWFGVILGLVFSVFLFVVCPQWLTSLIARLTGINKSGFLYNLIEGLLRVCIFVLYIVLTSLMKDIKRTYMYHGAEHKTITCYESGMELTVENVKKCKRVHDRCGTTFLFFVMLVSILVFSLVNSFIKFEGVYRMLLKIALLPFVAGLSYELLKALAKTDSWIFYPLKAPGLLLQRLTTKEPNDEMMEVAITAFNKVLEMDANENIKPVKFVTPEKTNKCLERVCKALKEGGVTDESDGEWIVSIVSGIKRSELKQNESLISASKVDIINKYVKERISGRPLWYIIGNTDFYGITLDVDERVLIPRPETEELIEKSLNDVKDDSEVLDMCTGSGAIAITIKKLTGVKVTAVDISDEALEVAKFNAIKNNVEIEFISSDMFDNLGERQFDVIISNPPYIKSGDIQTLDNEVKSFEPLLALDGGNDGLCFYRKILQNTPKYLKNCGVLYLECGINQANEIADIFNGYDVEIIKDINGIDRIIKIKNTKLKAEQND